MVCSFLFRPANAFDRRTTVSLSEMTEPRDWIAWKSVQDTEKVCVVEHKAADRNRSVLFYPLRSSRVFKCFPIAQTYSEALDRLNILRSYESSSMNGSF